MSKALKFRQAETADLSTIVALLADDPLGATRETATEHLDACYSQAFDNITRDTNNQLIVGQIGDEIVAVLQLTLIPSLTYRGQPRAMVEGVRVSRTSRGQGIGRRLFEYAIRLARQYGCVLLQLTTDKRRPDALAFYQQLGFVSSHEGMKLFLQDQSE